MSSKIFLQALQNKLKGGNARSIHLNALPGRLVTRLDLKQLDVIENGLALRFLETIFTKSSFEFKLSYDNIDLNQTPPETQKRLGVIAKRLNSTIIENEDYFKEHGTKTLGFGYPILIRRSAKDPKKIIKAPLLIWPLDAVKSRTKVNEWSILRNKTVRADGSLTEADTHMITLNEVLLSFIKGEDDITLPGLTPEVLEDAIIDPNELLDACAAILNALDPGVLEEQRTVLQKNFRTPIAILPEAAEIDSIANNRAYIHFGGVFGLFRAQKESIITDITKLLDRFDDFEFDGLQLGEMTGTPFSAVNTDPAQQAIMTTLGNHANQIIQGPPGTGKSQSLTALVTNALANGLKCLVVCEKKTALDVIKSNIERTNEQMASMVAVIDDVNSDREAIVDSVRERQSALPSYQQAERVRSQYHAASEKLTDITRSINEQHSALAQSLYDGMTWTHLVGRYLQLKKGFNDVPLKSVLTLSGFKFRENEQELRHILSYLSRANDLYTESAPYLSAFAPLSDELFRNRTTGEARIALEKFIEYGDRILPALQEAFTSLHAAGVKWRDTVYSAVPKAMRAEISSFEPYILGTDLSEKLLPEYFLLEVALDVLDRELRLLMKDGSNLREQYAAGLEAHYRGYNIQLSGELTSYFNFVNENVSAFGPGFLKNSSGAKFTTSLLAIFSGKHRKIKQGRLEVRGRVAGIKIAQQKQHYITHDYNDVQEVTHLSVYVDNVRALQQKMQAWQQTVPTTIADYTETISELKVHQEFGDIRQKAGQLLKRYQELTGAMVSDHQLLTDHQVKELNQLIKSVPGVLTEIKQHQQAFQDFRAYYGEHTSLVQGAMAELQTVEDFGEFKIYETQKPLANLTVAIVRCGTIHQEILKFKEQAAGFRTYHSWRSYYVGLNPLARKLIDVIIENLPGSWSDGFECWYLFWLLSMHEPPNLPKNDLEIQQYKRLKTEFDRAQLDNVVAQWNERQVGSLRVFKAKGQMINSLFNKKGAKGMRRNSLRTIVKSEFELFTDFFPVVLLNPSVCSSIIPLEEGIFDLVIFDEASQLRLEDTYAALIRGKAKIVSGDKHQMAPSSYFEGSGALLDPIEEEEKEEEMPESNVAQQRSDLHLADSESLLAYAVDRDYKENYLKVHYRSRHPYLIDFSNHAFYGRRLIPVPAVSDYVPIEFIQVDGIYDNQTNLAEAQQVVRILREKIVRNAEGRLPSVGVATFNLYQRNLILEQIADTRRNAPAFDSLMSSLGDSFFVKNLENIQGDERDIMILSTTFGRKTNGSWSQMFGPIIQSKGHRMLNVIITRAKDKVYICNSFPAEYVGQYAQLLQEKGNRGRAVLYAYLTYARAVSENNNELRYGVLQLLDQFCTDPFYDQQEPGLGSESVFEDEVYGRLAYHIGAERIEQQYRVGGFRIDMVIHPQQAGGRRIALECDGAKYHNSTEAYAWDVFRQEQLQKYGFVFYRIWSTNWWDAPDKELEKLLNFIRDQQIVIPELR
ncbi:MAG: hypothetical protein JWR54_1050 [Mucilaginibacter sp.]|nr:hypothetical protein [Mucilaginibacter sp.]